MLKTKSLVLTEGSLRDMLLPSNHHLYNMCNGDFTEIVKLFTISFKSPADCQGLPSPRGGKCQGTENHWNTCVHGRKEFLFSLLWILSNLCVKIIPCLSVSMVLSLLVHFPLVFHHTGEKANA